MLSGGGAPGMDVSSMRGRGRAGKQQETLARRWRWLPLALLLLASAIGFVLLFRQGGLTFQSIAGHSHWLHARVDESPLVAGLALFAIYVVITALSLPIATLVTVVAGYLFGIPVASVWVVLGATLGSMAVFLAARGALHDTLMERAGPWLKRMEKGFQEDALSYLLVLRLLPIFPFWLVNFVPALLGVKLWVYTLGTALGIIPGVVVYAALGHGLGHVIERGEEPDLSIILDPQIILPLIGLAVLAMLPVAWKRWQRHRKADA